MIMQLSMVAALFDCNFEHDLTLTGVGIDSRQVKPGELFVAIRGDKFDGHAFIAQAVENGASAVVCEKPESSVEAPQIIVDDCVKALAKIAKSHRVKMHCKTIALTGSNGKTSVKEMIASILPEPSFATHGNFNNHIGVPLCALKLTPEDKYAVFELGANHIGEIAENVKIVQPDVSLINNIAPAHIEGFGSIDGVARAKGEIYQGLASQGIAIVNNDDNYAHFWDKDLEDKRVVRFSKHKPADIYAEDIRLDANGFASFTLVAKSGEIEINLRVPGEHNISNALAAASCTLAVGLPLTTIKQGLEKFTGVAGRMAYKKGLNSSVVIDDSYNANLRSALTAIDVLSARDGFRILVMGDMGELGEYTSSHHQEVGKSARDKGIDLVLTLGEHSKVTAETFGENAQHYREEELLLDYLVPRLSAQTTVLVKGSRSSQMEKIVGKLEDNS